MQLYLGSSNPAFIVPASDLCNFLSLPSSLRAVFLNFTFSLAPRQPNASSVRGHRDRVESRLPAPRLAQRATYHCYHRRETSKLLRREPASLRRVLLLIFAPRQRSRSLKPRLVARRGETPFNYIDEKRLRFAATIPSIILAGRAAINDFRRGSCAPPALIRATPRGPTGESTER